MGLPLVITTMTESTMTRFGVALIGVTHVVCYFPVRLLRQFGRNQTEVPSDQKYLLSKAHDASFRGIYLHYWLNRAMLELGDGFAKKLTSSYKRQLTQDTIKTRDARGR